MRRARVAVGDLSFCSRNDWEKVEWKYLRSQQLGHFRSYFWKAVMILCITDQSSLEKVQRAGRWGVACVSASVSVCLWL